MLYGCLLVCKGGRALGSRPLELLRLSKSTQSTYGRAPGCNLCVDEADELEEGHGHDRQGADLYNRSSPQFMLLKVGLGRGREAREREGEETKSRMIARSSGWLWNRNTAASGASTCITQRKARLGPAPTVMKKKMKN